MIRLALIAAVAFVAGGCTSAGECGEGTQDVDGVCVPAAPEGRSVCGVNTLWDPALQACIGTSSTECDPLTTEARVQLDGAIVCYGVGTAHDCGTLACPQPEPGKVTLCGSIFELHEPDDDLRFDGVVCGGGAFPEEGACLLQLTPFDLGDLSTDGAGAAELTHGGITLTDCGRFVVRDIEAPASGTLALSVDDLGSAEDEHAPVATLFDLAPGQRVHDADVFALERSIDSAWTETAERPFGAQTFSDRGGLLAVFSHKDEVRGAVTALVDGIAAPTLDHYFSDADRGSIRRVEPSYVATGVNGAALLVDLDLGPVSGAGGGDLEGCAWPSLVADSIPGMVLVRRFDSRDPGSGEVCE